MKRIIAVSVALVLGSVFAFAAGKYSGKFTFGGSTTVQPIANVAIEQFVKANPNVKISYEGLGSGTGLKQLAEGTISLAGSSRDLKQSELDAGLVPVVIARDALAVTTMIASARWFAPSSRAAFGLRSTYTWCRRFLGVNASSIAKPAASTPIPTMK